MKRAACQLLALLVSAVVSGGLITSPALAQEKAKSGTQERKKGKQATPTQKVLLDNEKVRVLEVQYKPGDENKTVPSSSSRVVRALKGGTLLRTYADGKTQKVEWKAGEVRFLEAEKVAYTAKNVGRSDVHLYVVVLK
jgi:hypothetical protein